MLEYLIDPDPIEKTPEDYGYIHEDDLPDIDFIKDQMRSIIQSVYITGDVMRLESSLDEVCHELNMKIHQGAPVLYKKQPTTLGAYIEYQRDLINSFKTKKGV